jgi:outer membrane protein assembly factor BamB
MNNSLSALVLISAASCAFQWPAGAGDQPQWGQAWSRNMVSEEKGLPESFDPKAGRNVKWTADLGTETHSTPIVAGGRVYIGTNNGHPRDPKHQGDRGVLMCFDEKSGGFLWQLLVPKREEDPYMDWPNSGISSPVTVKGDRVYVVSNRGEVMCLDAHGMTNGNDGPFREEGAHMIPRPGPSQAATAAAPVEEASPIEPGSQDADILWSFDLTKRAGIWSHDAAHSSILIHGSYLYLNTGTGVDNTHKRIRTPNAPSLVVLDRGTGQLAARDNERIATNIFHCTWSSPSMEMVAGRPLIFFAGGNGIVYAFEPIRTNPPPGQVFNLKKVWQFDFDPGAPKGDIHPYLSNRREGPSNIYGMPVFYRDRIYVAGGGDIFWGKNQAWLKCIDATKRGDITKKGLIWSYPLERHVMSTVAISQDLLFIADCGRKFHCLDPATGKAYWTHDIKGECWASPLIADGRVYLGTRSGTFYIFALSREKNVIDTIEMGSPISATATAANGVLYVATMNRLYALQKGAGGGKG